MDHVLLESCGFPRSCAPKDEDRSCGFPQSCAFPRSRARVVSIVSHVPYSHGHMLEWRTQFITIGVPKCHNIQQYLTIFCFQKSSYYATLTGGKCCELLPIRLICSMDSRLGAVLRTNDYLKFLIAVLMVNTKEGLLQTATIILQSYYSHFTV